ncbi:MAG: hypothetical protein ACK4WD_00480 [Flavobacteriales bacterium]|jgi:hypothetical protein
MRKLIWIILLSIVVIIVGLILYFSHFSGKYSDKSDDLSNFATFNGYFLSIINLIILGYISYITFQTTHTYNRLQIRPLLFITLDKPEQIIGTFKDSWYVINGAKNAALNLIVRYTTDRNSEAFTKWVSCTSLAESQRLELFWVHWADKIEICFTDLTNERFYSFEFMDYSGKTKEISKQEFSEFMRLAAENRDNNLTHLRDKLEQYISSEKLKGTADIMKDYTNNFINKQIKA